MDQETTYKWIQERLRELNSGTLSEADRARLVDLAKNDPFVADALEGFHANPEVDHNVSLDKLAQRIQHTRRERRRWLIPNLTVTAIAASFLVILATYGVIRQVQKKNEEAVFVFVAPDSLRTADTIVNDVVMEAESRSANAAEENKSAAPETSVNNETTPTTPADASARKNISAPTGTETSQTELSEVTAAEPIKTTPPSSVPPAPPLLDKRIPAGDDISTQTQPVLAGAQSKESTRAKRDEGYYANQMDPDVMQRYVTGRIVDVISGEPIVYAKLNVSFSNQLFFADAQGQFELYLPERDAVIQVTNPGYVDSTLVIHQGEENIVVGLKTEALVPLLHQEGAKTKGPVYPNHNPTIESYYNVHGYITSSSTLELSTDPSSARRKVVVQFKVNNNGRPKDISVIESSRDKTYDGEAVRLIDSGPDWVCPGGESPCVRQYTFYFK